MSPTAVYVTYVKGKLYKPLFRESSVNI